MCNLFEQEMAWAEYCALMQAEELGIVTDNLDLPLGEIRPTDKAAHIMATPGGSKLELLQFGISFKPGGQLYLNLKSEGRLDPPGVRGLLFVSRFFEFTGAKSPKSKFAFSLAKSNHPLALATIRRAQGFAILTTSPGPDTLPYHSRQLVPVPPNNWRRWLADPSWPEDLMRPMAPGTFAVQQVR